MARYGFAAGLAALATVCGGEAVAQNVSAFPSRLQIIIAATTGGGYDVYGRLVARHIGNELPGKPQVIVMNMPGASGIKAVNYIYSVAPKDGSIIGAFDSASPMYEAYNYEGVQYKAEKLSWIGSLDQGVSVLTVMDTTGVRTIEDAKKTEILMGAQTLVGTNSAYPLLLNKELGTKFKLVTGYLGSAGINMAMERGEVQGRGSNPWASWKSTKPDWVANGTIVPLVQLGPKKHPDLQNVPMLTELATNDEQRQMFEFISSSIGIERPYAAPPEVPADRIKILRRAFERMSKSTPFLDDAGKMGLDVDPLPGESVQKVIAGILATPPAIVEKVKLDISKE